MRTRKRDREREFEIRLPRAIIGALLGLYRFVITVSFADSPLCSTDTRKHAHTG